MSADRQQQIADRLEALARRSGGVLTPDAVVEDARDLDSPLHDSFEWDDSRAAHGYRLVQARQLIRGVRVVVRQETTTLSAPMYVRSPDAKQGEQGYIATTELRKNADSARAALVDAYTEAGGHLRRAKELAAFFGLEEQTQEAETGVAALRKMALDQPEQAPLQ